jgi:1-acyl-sn-glycerol-3-phosphate acyltransferase
MLFYRLVRGIVAGSSRIVFRADVRGRERLPKSGGYVLAPSHRSMMDIPFAAWLTPRKIRYMGKVSLFEIPVLGWFFKVLGGFPVQRDGTDRKALRESIDMLQRGEILLVYPEGTRQHGPKIEPLQPGAAYLALRAGVPIVPVGIAGTEEIFRSHGTKRPHFGRVAIVVGEPIVPVSRDGGVVPRAEVDALTAQLHDALQRVFDEANERREALTRG